MTTLDQLFLQHARQLEKDEFQIRMSFLDRWTTLIDHKNKPKPRKPN